MVINRRKETYGFAIVGTGAIGNFHAELLQQVNRARLVAVCDYNHDRGRLFAERFHCRLYTDLDELLSDDEIDIVNICSPSSLHGGQAIACARAGKHVITEKPMDITIDGADRIIEAFRQSGTKLCVISQHRFSSSISKIKKLIEQDAFGRLVLGTGATNWYRSQEYYDNSKWRGSLQSEGGGALLNQGIHIVDQLQYLMGPVDSVFAHCETLGHERIEVEDVASAVLRFRNGAIGTLTGTTAAFPGVQTRIEVFGTKGSAIIEDGILVFCQYKNLSDSTDEVIIDVNDRIEEKQTGNGASNALNIADELHLLQFQDMIHSIEEERKPLVSEIEGRKALEIILGIYESNRSGKQIFLK